MNKDPCIIPAKSVRRKSARMENPTPIVQKTVEFEKDTFVVEAGTADGGAVHEPCQSEQAPARQTTSQQHSLRINPAHLQDGIP